MTPGIHLIEASAGTGKTWTIAEHYAECVQSGLRPDQILVVTFTEAATAELRERIRARLVEKGELEAAHAMDEAAVHTIHGWALSALRRHSLRTGMPFDAEVDNDVDTLWRDAAYDWFRTFIYPEKGPPLRRVFLLDAVSSPDKLKASARKARPAPPVVMDEEVLSTCFESLESARRGIGALDVAGALAALRTALDSGVFNAKFTDLLTRNLDSDAAMLQRWINTGRPAQLSNTILSRFRQSRITKECLKNRRADCPEHALFEAIEALPSVPKEVSKDIAIAAANAWVGKRFDAMRARRAQVGFDDILVRLRDALNSDPQLRTRMAEEFPVALVDEFQDTDSVQWAIFRSIYQEAADTSLHLVGDPKQSIYSFRGADLDVYLAATSAATSTLERLDTNYRSSPRLVAAVNQIFEHCRGYEAGAFVRGTEIDYHPVKAAISHGCLTQGGLEIPPLTVLHDSAVHGKHEALGRLANAFASVIVDAVGTGSPQRIVFRDKDGQDSPADPEHVAVLVNNRTEAWLMRKALGARGLPSVYLSERDSIFATQEADDLALLLEAALEPRDLGRMRALAACRLLDHDLAALEQMRNDERELESFVERIVTLAETWLKSGPLPMVHRFAADFALRARHGGDAERVLTNLLHLGELLQHAASELDGEHALVGWLHQRLTDAAARDSDSPDVLRLESDSRIVTIVTVHKSKGLQYPLVFVPFASIGPVRAEHDESQRKFYVAVTRAQYGCWLGVLPTVSGKKASPVTHTGLIGYALSGGAEIPVNELQTRLTALKGDCADIALAPLPPADHTPFSRPEPQTFTRAAKVYGGEPRAPWWIGSFTSMSRVLESQRSHGPAGDKMDAAVEKAMDEADDGFAAEESPPQVETGIHALPRHADTGTFLHGVLEWAADAPFAHAASDDALRLAEISRRARFRFPDATVPPMLSNWLQRVLSAPLAVGPCAPVVLAGLSRYQPELEFWISAKDVSARVVDDLLHEYILPDQMRPQLGANMLTGMLKGFIDLAFEHEGRWFVSDYKSNHLGPDESAYTEKMMAAQMLKKRYDLQAVLYTLALHRQLKARLPGYDYDQHMGGAVYLFLRGIAVYHFIPPRPLIEKLDAVFEGRGVRHVA